MPSDSAIPLIVILGPTASGKTEVAVDVAEALGGEIVNADSMQVYRELNAGTAKPTAEQRARVRFHLLDCVSVTELYSVRQYQQMAEAAISDIHQRGKQAILCGGTGLYIKAVLEHFTIPPGRTAGPTRARWEAFAREHGPEALHRELARRDAESAARLHPHDVRRVVRALEVITETGRPLTPQQAVDRDPEIHYNAAKFGLAWPRELLYGRIDRRAEAMVAGGMVEETQELLGQGVSAETTAFQALGYRQILGYLRGEYDLAEAVRLIKRDTRRFAKRQLTWFRRDSAIAWLECRDVTDLRQAAETIVERAKQSC